MHIHGFQFRVQRSSKACTFAMVCGNAEGVLNTLIRKLRDKPALVSMDHSGSDGICYYRTKSSWFDHQSFEDWFVSLYVPPLKKQNGTKVLIGNNLRSSHISLEEKHYKICATTFLCDTLAQPLDMTYFHSMESHW